MKTCRRSRKELRERAGDGADLSARSPWKEHLAMCPDCRKQWEDAEKIIQGAAALKEDVGAAMAGVDWDALPERIADAALARRKQAPDSARARVRSFGWKPVFAAALGGLLIGASVTVMVLLKTPARAPSGAGISASGEFLDRAELSVARRETIDFLSKSRALLLDFVQAPPEQAGQVIGGDSAARRTAGLLTKKRFMDAHLDDASMAKARAICDQIERLFVELSQISDGISAAEAARIQRYVEEKNLLLRIKLLQGELAESEV